MAKVLKKSFDTRMISSAFAMMGSVSFSTKASASGMNDRGASLLAFGLSFEVTPQTSSKF